MPRSRRKALKQVPPPSTSVPTGKPSPRSRGRLVLIVLNAFVGVVVAWRWASPQLLSRVHPTQVVTVNWGNDGQGMHPYTNQIQLRCGTAFVAQFDPVFLPRDLTTTDTFNYASRFYLFSLAGECRLERLNGSRLIASQRCVIGNHPLTMYLEPQNSDQLSVLCR